MALEAREACIPGSHVTRDSSWQTTTPQGTAKIGDRNILSLFEKEAYLLVLELQPEGQALGLADI